MEVVGPCLKNANFRTYQNSPSLDTAGEEKSWSPKGDLEEDNANGTQGKPRKGRKPPFFPKCWTEGSGTCPVAILYEGLMYHRAPRGLINFTNRYD